jgi:hypothetical protein
MAAPVIQRVPTSGNGAVQRRGHFEPVSADVTVIATSDGTTNQVLVGKTSHTIFVTHISVAVTTDNAATLTFQDDADTPIVIAKTKASPGIGPIVWDFGEDGTPLTQGKDLDLNISAAGLAGRVHIEGYYRRTAVASA